MKKPIFVVMLCLIVLGAGGCFISVKEECVSKEIRHHPAIDSTIAEIDAIRMLGSESARLNVLRAIAGRPGLSPEARIHLVEAVRMLGSESAREEVLMALAENPPRVPEPLTPAPAYKELND